MKEVQLMRIVIEEEERDKSGNEGLYMKLNKLLWDKGFPGATLIRVDEGIDDHDNFHTEVLEDIDMPIIIESIASVEMIESVIPRIIELSPEVQITIVEGYEFTKEGVQLDKDQYYMLKIYTKESSRVIKAPAYEEILSLLRDNGLIWSILLKGIAGFGKDHVIHKQSMFSLSEHTPIIIESVGKGESLETLLPKLNELLEDGFIFMSPVNTAMNN